MKFVRFWFGCVVALAGVAAAEWEDLFNGRDLHGWDPRGKVDWEVKDASQFNQGRVEFRSLRIQKLGLP